MESPPFFSMLDQSLIMASITPTDCFHCSFAASADIASAGLGTDVIPPAVTPAATRGAFNSTNLRDTVGNWVVGAAAAESSLDA
mmetsp:Transcript_13413/g.22288  ORF Transcript_13413/g.22288 Transcript_13413/m.22288 type:complete len:84 (-) Transcript_13413:216-467(-)